MKACARCGAGFFLNINATRCIHSPLLVQEITPEHVRRIAAAYALGKRHNPDHDETSYYAQTAAPPR